MTSVAVAPLDFQNIGLPDTLIRNMPTPHIIGAEWLNPSLIRAQIDVSDIVRKVTGPKPVDHLVKVSVRFETFATLGDDPRPVQFDPTDSFVYCQGDAPAAPVRLEYAGGRYTGEVPRGRAFPDGQPNYYDCHLRAAKNDYVVGRVPVVQRLTITAPTPGSAHFADQDVTVSFGTGSWMVLWDHSDPHFQFQHTDTVSLTERLADDAVRLVGERTEAGIRDDTATLTVTPRAPYAAAGSAGSVYVVTRYRSNHLTEGPTDFLLQGWTSSAGATPVPIVWQL